MGCSTSLAVDISAERRLHTYIDMLFDAYGKPTEQVGYTDGHYCLTKDDRDEAVASGSSLLYGEILAAGITKLLDSEHLNAAKAQVLYDLGMGVGKLVMQAFLAYSNLKLIRGVELAFSRFQIAEDAVLRLVSLQPDRFEVDERVPGEFIRAHTIGKRKRRVLELRRGNMWEMRDISSVDVVVMHTELTATGFPRFRKMVCDLKRGARFVTYQDLSKHWPHTPMPFVQMEANVDDGDQFATSWSALKGHHLFCWEKTVDKERAALMCGEEIEETKEALGGL